MKVFEIFKLYTIYNNQEIKIKYIKENNLINKQLIYNISMKNLKIIIHHILMKFKKT